MEGDILALVAGMVALISTRLTTLLKVYIKKVLPGESEQAEEARKAVVNGLAMVVSGLVAWGGWLAASWFISVFGEVAFKLIASGALGTEGLYLLKSWKPKYVEMEIIETPERVSVR